ncbi:MAG TPA: hypothetical protein VMM15_13255 [Bradyrhizobium sp.]|nr:hypothetical protein [Bradyrhizobium sp.]
MRRQSETLLVLMLLPIFFLGIFPMMLMALLGFLGLCILGVLMICVGLADGLTEDCDFNRELIVGGFTRPSERAAQASRLSSARRLATWSAVAGAGMVIAGVAGALYS